MNTPSAATLDIDAIARADAQTTLTVTAGLTAAVGDGADVLVLAARPTPTAEDGAADPAAAGETPNTPTPGVDILTDGAATDGVDTDALARLLPTLDFRAGLDATVRVPAAGLTSLPVTTLLVVGVGTALDEAADTTRDAAALGDDRAGVLHRAAGRAARALAGTERAVVALPAADEASATAVTHGLASGAYAWSARRPAHTTPLAHAVVALPADAPAEAVAEAGTLADRALALAGAERLARDLVNEPPNRLTPAAFAEVARAAGAAHGLEVEVLDEHELAAQGFGGIVGVGQGSVHPPRLVRVSWVPQDAARRVALIGKGITFDSGGLSLKPPASMPEMKSDMAGAATVLATVVAASRAKVAARVDGWLALAENLPGTDAQRPSDIVTMYGGTTVEIVNTDAEGRLVMADALARAVEDAPDAVLDVATLTGAQLVALGTRVSGVMGTPALRDLVVARGAAASEAFWAMPLPEHLRSSLDTPYAKLRNANMGSRWGGMLTAGLFLREFVGSVPWAHLDVAGPAFNDGAPWGGVPTGGTGFAVRTLVDVLGAIAEGARVR